MSPPVEAACQESTGFLFSHECGQPMAGSCDRCGKIVCKDHVTLGEEGTLCTSCTDDEDDDEGEEGDSDGESGSTHDEDDPSYYYKDYGYYGSNSGWGGGSSKDPNDFTEADGESLRNEDDASFEEDLGGS